MDFVKTEIERVVKKGDYYYALVKNHPNKTKNGYVLLHRVVIENHLGRYLTNDEIVHHINRNRFDNRIENLDVMHYKEHRKLHMAEHKLGFTETSVSIPVDDGFKYEPKITTPVYCQVCLKEISCHSILCQKCDAFKKRKANRPSKQELQELLWLKPTTTIAKIYGVSDKAIEKWSKAYGLDKPPRGYWQKQRVGKL